MRRSRVPIITTLVFVACAPSAAPVAQGDTAGTLSTIDSPAGKEVAVALSDAAKARADIATRTLGAAARAGVIRLAGELLADPGLVTTVQAPIAGRLAPVSRGHWPSLGEHVDSGAPLGQISDARPLTAPRAGIVQEVDAQPGQLVQPGQTLLTLANFAMPLARVVWTADAPLPPPEEVTIGPLLNSAAHGVPARLMGAPPTVDSLTRFPVYLYRANRTWPGSGPGTPVVAMLAAPAVLARAVFVPTDAAIQWEGLMWVYVERQPARYVRVPLDTGHPVDGGWLVTGPSISAGARVVVRGAQQLLSQEFRSRATVGDNNSP